MSKRKYNKQLKEGMTNMPYWYWNFLDGIKAQMIEQSPCKGSGVGLNPANAFHSRKKGMTSDSLLWAALNLYYKKRG